MSNNLNLFSYKKNSSVRLRKINTEYYLLFEGTAYQLNEISAVIFKYIGSKMTVDELSEKIFKNYEAENINIIQQDIVEFIDMLLEKEIIYV